MTKPRSLFAMVIAAPLAIFAAGAHAIPVELELALLIDISDGISETNFEKQLFAYRDAFKSAAVKNAIEALGDDGTVLFARFFPQQTALEFGNNGCGAVVSYPKTEGTNEE